MSSEGIFDRRPQASRSVGWSRNNLTGETHETWSTRCADCKTGFQAHDKGTALLMWWEHVRDEHPTAYSSFLQLGLVP